MTRKQKRAERKLSLTPLKPSPVVGPCAPETLREVQTTYIEALRLHQAGHLNEAEHLYRQVLAVDSRHDSAIHLLGVIAHQVGRNDVAVELISKAIGINSIAAVYYSNLGVALKSLGRLDDAVAAYRNAICNQPDYAEAHSNLGNVLRDLGRLDEAVASYGAALRIDSDYAAAHYNLGNALKDLGRLDEAVAAYRAAICIKRDYGEAHSNLGNVLRKLGRHVDAVAAYSAALRDQPDLAETHFNLGVVLRDLGRLADAVVAFRNAVRIKPDFAEAHSNLGVTLCDLGRFDDAVAAHSAAIRLKPDYAEAHYNLGNAVYGLGYLDDAVAAYNAALDRAPDFAAAHYNLGNALKDLGRVGDAVVAYSTALRIKPEDAEAHYNESLSRLLLGDFDVGWQKLEWRWQSAKQKNHRRRFLQPQWRGEEIAGQVVLLHMEQGLGDSLQFCRYATLVAARGGRVALETPRSLLRLLSGLAGVSSFVVAGDELPDFDYHCPLMSLPLALGTRIETIPAAMPYLAAEPARVAMWRDRIGPSGFCVGIVWQGSPGYEDDHKRSIPLARFAPLAQVPGVRLISLQKINGLDQLERLPAGMQVETLGAGFDKGPDAFLDAAGVMMSLDLIVSVDTATAHLAGALGRPVWLPLATVPHWVWMLEREDTPWYPNTRLFRQREPGVWQEVFERIAHRLKAVISDGSPVVWDVGATGNDTTPNLISGATVLVPISIGELMDKITILEIKEHQISDEAKRANVIKELSALRRVAAATLTLDASGQEIVNELRRINELLWGVEDAIRECEGGKQFGTKFIDLARSVYRYNDQRALLKKQLNELVGSELVEEKSYASYGNSL